MALSRKTKAEIEEFGEAGNVIQEMIAFEKKKESPNERVIQDLERLAAGYDQKILIAAHGKNKAR